MTMRSPEGMKRRAIRRAALYLEDYAEELRCDTTNYKVSECVLRTAEELRDILYEEASDNA